MATYESNRNDNYSQQHKSKLIELYGQYRGMRALLLTRVSTGSQSHEAQERVVRDLLIDLLDLELDEHTHIVHDTYTGLEYRYRTSLDEILRMAERREFDVLCLDVLDRGLGRKGVSREVFRGQLRELGIHILTTEPGDHSDDDSLEGQLMRLLRGYKAEEEVNDFVRRTKNAKRDKALGNSAKGIPPKVVGTGPRPYGFKYIRNGKGEIETLELNHDVVLIDRKGVKWTEVRVMTFIFRCAKRRVTLWQICKRLNEIGIPSPCISVGIKYRSKGVVAEKLLWQSPTVSKMVRNVRYSGRYIVNKYHTTKVPGKRPRYNDTSPEDQIIVPIPVLVSPDLQEDVIKNLSRNQRYSMRNNQQKDTTLLRGGLAKCGNCGRTATPQVVMDRYKYYHCTSAHSLHKCPGCSISANKVDDAAWNVSLEIIYKPTLVDNALEKQRTSDPTASRRKQIKKDMQTLEDERSALQSDLTRMIRERKLDRNTEEVLTKRLREIDQQVHQYDSESADDEKMQREWETVQQELKRLHKKCEVMRDKLKKDTYVPTYKDKRDMIEFFGITATLWENGHVNPESNKPERIRIQARFADIVLPYSR